MAAPLLTGSHVVGEWDPDLRGWWARDWTPGPAGTAGLALGGGVELDVDVASPATLVGLWVPSPLPRRGGRAVRRLLGDERAAELVALGVGGRPGGPAVLGPERVRRFGPPRTRAWSVDPDTGGVAAPLARMALAGSAAVAQSPDPLVRALGHVDAAVAGLALGGGLGVGGPARSHALAGLELLLDLARRGELDGRPVDGTALLDALGRLGPVLPEDGGPGLRALRGDLAAGVVAFAPTPRADPGWAAGGAARPAADAYVVEAAMAPPPPAAAAPVAARLREAAPERAAASRPRPVGHLLPLDLDALPLAFAAAGTVVARTTTPSEAEVRVAGRAADGERWWARAFDADGELVAAAPLLDAGVDAVARLLLPPERLTQVTVDITDRPGEPRPSPAALGVLDAVRLGQAAARAERLGRAGDAAARWHRSAAAWSQVGSDQRAGLARELATGARPGRAPEPLLADALVESLEE